VPTLTALLEAQLLLERLVKSSHAVVKQSMVEEGRVETDVVHVNADYDDKASDHDPTVIRMAR
jgi:hypothetical protein